MNKREAQAIETKNRITEIAMDMILSSNFNDVTVNQICKKANVSKGAFYHHFNSKSDIVVQIYKVKVLDAFKFDDITSSTSSYIEKISLATLSFLQLTKSNGIEVVKQVFTHEIQTDLKYYLSEGDSVFEQFKTLIEQGQVSGEIRNDLSSKDIALFIIRLSRGIIYDWCIYKGKYDFDTIAQKDINIFLESIKTR